MIRAADVTLKERRRLILMVRESPLHLTSAVDDGSGGDGSDLGATDARRITSRKRREIVDHSVDRVLDLIGLPSPETRRWNGPEPTRSK